MHIPAAMVSGIHGINSAQSGLTQATIDVARAPAALQQNHGNAASETVDNTAAQVAAMSAVHQAQASAKVIASADNMLGTLIDIKV